MLPFFKKDPGISNTTGERFCLFSINKNVPSPAVWNRQLQNFIFGNRNFPADPVSTLFYLRHRFFSPLFCLFFDKAFGNPPDLHIVQFVSMRFVKTQAAGSHLCNSEIDCNKVPVHLFFIAHRTHRDFKPCFFVFHRKNLLFSYLRSGGQAFQHQIRL